MYQGTVQDTSATAAKLVFHSRHGREEFSLKDSKDHEFMLHHPLISVQPELFRSASLSAPEILSTPRFLEPTPEKPLPPHPHDSRLLTASPKCFTYTLPPTPHTLHHRDLTAWGCTRAGQLADTACQVTVWAYLDVSAGRGGYGWAATVYMPNSSVWHRGTHRLPDKMEGITEVQGTVYERGYHPALQQHASPQTRQEQRPQKWV